MNKPAPALALSEGQRQTLQRLSRSTSAAHRLVVRSRALLLAGDGVANARIAAECGVAVSTVVGWRKRFAADGLREFGRVAKGRGRKPSIPASKVEEIVRLTQEGRPDGETHWSCRSMAKASDVSPATVQALDRTQPSLPMKKGRAGTMTHDYKRNGTTTLFAALNVLTGVVIGQCLPRHRHEEFLKFLRRIDREVPTGLAVHLILDNYATHKHADVTAWLAKHPRFHLHFTPTSSSWLNLVERWFRDITDKAIRRGVFPSVPDLIAAIEDYLRVNNADPKPFMWTASAESILEKVRRGRVALEAVRQN